MNPIALITGTTAGIGKACAEILARNQYRLIITGRRQERLNSLAEAIRTETLTEVKVLCFDVRDRQAVERHLNSLPEEWKAVDVLVNNAGGAHGFDLFQDADIEDWETMIDANVKGLLYVSQMVSGWMIGHGRGHIINISSVAGKEVYEKGHVYCASKFAVDALTKGMRIDLLQHGIRVTAVNPGLVDTEFSTVRFKGDKARADKVYEGITPLTAEDIAETVWFAVSRPSHVNINDILVMPTAQASVAYVHRKTE